MKTLVLKFGGAAVATAGHFHEIAKLIKLKMSSHGRVVVVVSAMKGATDELIVLAKKVHPNPPKREYDMLLTVGERISISLLAMALNHIGLKAQSFTGSQSGIITTSCHSEAKIVDVKPFRIEKSLNDGHVAIVAGFQGVSKDGEITTLGRGGSDTTAVALAIALNRDQEALAEVEFYKDVKGIYTQDPHENIHSTKYETISYEEALNITLQGAKILHPRAIALAKNRVRLRVRSFKELQDAGTLIAMEDGSCKAQNVYEEEMTTV